MDPERSVNFISIVLIEFGQIALTALVSIPESGPNQDALKGLALSRFADSCLSAGAIKERFLTDGLSICLIHI